MNSAGVKLGYFRRSLVVATVGVVRWPAAGDTAGSSLRRLSSLQHRIYNLLGLRPCGPDATCLEDGLERDHVVVAERQRLEPADRALAERPDAGQLQLAERRPDVGLRHADLDPTLLEVLGERLQLACVALAADAAARRRRRADAPGHHRAAAAGAGAPGAGRPRAVVQVARGRRPRPAAAAAVAAAEVDGLAGMHVVVVGAAALRRVDGRRVHRLEVVVVVVAAGDRRVRVSRHDLDRRPTHDSTS